MTDARIRAAGGVVWRPLADGNGRTSDDGVEIILVHRPKYDDWSLPKGKLDPGETWEEAAVREVLEETGLKVELGTLLGDVEYLDRGKKDRPPRPKIVRYWAMRAIGGTFTPHKEIDDVRWLPPADALGALTHALDHETVRRFLARR